jgi:hypothetical protein
LQSLSTIQTNCITTKAPTVPTDSGRKPARSHPPSISRRDGNPQ